VRFNEKRVFVTGGYRGIGAEIVRAFASEGAKVFFTYKSNQAEGVRFEQQLNKQGLFVKAYEMDVTDASQVTQVIEMVVEQFGPIDILINNAGITRDGFLLLMPEASWDEVIDTNLKGTYHCCKATLTSMISARSGVIINVSSVAGLVGVSSQTNYSASKAGLIGFTRSLSREVAKKNIRVNAVAPGYIATDMVEKVPERVRKGFVDKIANGRLGEPSEVAKVVTFLASDDASYIYGQTIVVDGGMI